MTTPLRIEARNHTVAFRCKVLNKTNSGHFVYLFLLKTPLSSILGFMKFGLTITITFYE